MHTEKLVDPRKEYYTDKYPKQEQPYPGVQNKMTPVPDCGEESYKGSGKLTGRKALVTGGDSGIGRAAAIAYAREGADVAIAYLPAEESDAQEVKAIVEAEGRKAVLIPGDLNDEAYARQMVHTAADQLGGLDILALVAGRQVATKDISEITTQQLEEVFRVNVFSIFWTLQEAVQVMPEGSSIIFTTSTQAYDPSENIPDYAATKAAIKVLAEVYGHQFGKKGIRVNAVAPGPVWTALQISGGQLPERIPEFGRNVALGRAGQPVELSAIYVFLASDDGSFVTGATFGIGGGAKFG